MYFPVKGLSYELQALANHQGLQGDGRKLACSEIEMNTVECLEAYGVTKGMTKCAQYMEDLRECRYSRYRQLRYTAMKLERQKQILKGERKPSEMFMPSYSYDAYFTDVFTP